MSHRLLSADGTVRKVEAGEIDAAVVVDATDSDGALKALIQASADSVVLVEIPGSADGRAFSVVGHLAASRKEKAPTTWITGDILPDQVSLAFQCGASGVLVSDEMWGSRGEEAWLNSLKPAVKIAYRSQVWSAVSDISQLRH